MNIDDDDDLSFPRFKVESCGGAAYCNPSYDDDDDDDDTSSDASGEERHHFITYPPGEDLVMPRLGFLEPIMEETSDDLQSEESHSSGWGWDGSTDGASSVIHVFHTGIHDCLTEEQTLNNNTPEQPRSKDEHLNKWLEDSFQELVDEKGNTSVDDTFVDKIEDDVDTATEKSIEACDCEVNEKAFHTEGMATSEIVAKVNDRNQQHELGAQDLVHQLQVSNSDLLILFENEDAGDTEEEDLYSNSQQLIMENCQDRTITQRLPSEVRTGQSGPGDNFAEWNSAIDEYLFSLVSSPWDVNSVPDKWNHSDATDSKVVPKTNSGQETVGQSNDNSRNETKSNDISDDIQESDKATSLIDSHVVPVHYDQCVVISDDHEYCDEDEDWEESSSDDDYTNQQKGGRCHVYEDLTQIEGLDGECSSDSDGDAYYECVNGHVVCSESLVRSLSLTDLQYCTSPVLKRVSSDDGNRTGNGAGVSECKIERVSSSGESEPETPSCAHARPSNENLSEDSGYSDAPNSTYQPYSCERADSSSPDEDARKFNISVIPEDEEGDERPGSALQHDLASLPPATPRERLEQLLLRDHERRTEVYTDAICSDARELATDLNNSSNGMSLLKKDFELLYNNIIDSDHRNCGEELVSDNNRSLKDKLLLINGTSPTEKKHRKCATTSKTMEDAFNYDDGQLKIIETDKLFESKHQWKIADDSCFYLESKHEGIKRVKSLEDIEYNKQHLQITQELVSSFENKRCGLKITEEYSSEAPLLKSQVRKKHVPPGRKKRVTVATSNGFPELDEWSRSGGWCQEELLQREWERSVKSGRAATDDWLVMRVNPPQPRRLFPVRSFDCLPWTSKEPWETDIDDLDNGVLSAPASMIPPEVNKSTNTSLEVTKMESANKVISIASCSIALAAVNSEDVSSSTSLEEDTDELSSSNSSTTSELQLKSDEESLCIVEQDESEDTTRPIDTKPLVSQYLEHQKARLYTKHNKEVEGREIPDVQLITEEISDDVRLVDTTCPIVASAELKSSSKITSYLIAAPPCNKDPRDISTELKTPTSEVKSVQTVLASLTRPKQPPPPPPVQRAAGGTTGNTRNRKQEAPEVVTAQHLNNKQYSTASTKKILKDELKIENEENDQAAKALQDSYRHMERAISSLEHDIELSTPPVSPRPASLVSSTTDLLNDLSYCSSKPLSPSRTRIMDARCQFFNGTSPCPGSPTNLSPVLSPVNINAVFDSFRQRAQEGRERVARSVVDLSEIERVVRDQIDCMPVAVTFTSEPKAEAYSVNVGDNAQQIHPIVNSVSSHSKSNSGYLETDVDTLQSREVLHDSEEAEGRGNKEATYNFTPFEGNWKEGTGRRTISSTKASSMMNLPGDVPSVASHQYNSRKICTLPSNRICPDEADRARSMEFLLDADNKAAAEPPENRLMKGGAVEGKQPSQHEIRIQQSLQQLNVPEWFKNSPHSRSGSFLLLKQRSPVEQHSNWQAMSAASSRSPSASSLVNSSATVGGCPGPIPTGASTPMSTPTRLSQPYCLRYSRWSREGLNTTSGSPTLSPQENGSFQLPNWTNSRHSSFASSPSTSPSTTGATSFTRRSSLPVNQRQPYLGWRSSERLTREASSNQPTANPTRPFYRSAAERLSAGPGYYAIRFGSSNKDGSEKNPVSSTHLSPITPSTQGYSSTSTPCKSTSCPKTQLTTQVPNGYVQCQTTAPPPPHHRQTDVREAKTSPKTLRQRIIWVESSFVGMKPGSKLTGAAQSASSVQCSSEGYGSHFGHTNFNNSQVATGSGTTSDICPTEARRSFGHIDQANTLLMSTSG